MSRRNFVSITVRGWDQKMVWFEERRENMQEL